MPLTIPSIPTRTQILDMMPLVDGRSSIAWNEIITLLKSTELGEAIDDLNSSLELTGTKKIQKPRNVVVAPDTITDDYLNHLMVGMRSTKKPIGTRAFNNIYTVAIYSINERMTIRDTIDATDDLSGPISGLLGYMLSGWLDRHGREVWQKLTPLGKEGLPAEYSAYTGFTLVYEMWQAPNATTWIKGE